MSLVIARKKRTALYLSIAGLLIMVASVSAISARDPDGVTIRVGMVMMVVGAALWLPWQALLPAALLVWFGPNYIRSATGDETLFGTNMLLELPGLLGIAALAGLARMSLRRLEDEDVLLGATNEEFNGLDPITGVYEERLLRPAIEGELARARRFGHEFALVLVGIDEMRQRFDYRDPETWETAFNATASLLRSTRMHIDRAYRLGASNFAMILPESGEREVTGLIRRLRRVARHADPAQGEPGGPLPTHYGATFFPQCATTADDLLRRAEIALRLAEKNSSRIQMDGAEAPGMPPLETLRRETEFSDITAEEEPAIGEPAPTSLTLVAEPANVAEKPEVASLALVAQPVEAVEEPAVEPEAVREPIPLRPYAMAVEDSPMDAEYEAGFVGEPMVVEEPVALEPVMDMTSEEAAEVEGIEPETVQEPIPIASYVSKTTEEPAAEDSLTELMKHMEETRAMLRSLRTGAAS